MRIGGIGNRLPPSLSVRRSGKDAEDDHADANRNGIRRLHGAAPPATRFRVEHRTLREDLKGGKHGTLPGQRAFLALGGGAPWAWVSACSFIASIASGGGAKPSSPSRSTPRAMRLFCWRHLSCSCCCCAGRRKFGVPTISCSSLLSS